MMFLLFVLLFVMLLLAWMGRRKLSIAVFAFSLLIAILVFINDINTKLNLQL